MIVVIADDLTGANDTGVQFRKHGLKTIVKIDYANFCKKDVENYDVVSINADSRILDTKSSYERVYGIAEKCNDIKFDYMYKKIDSILRGNPGAELEGVMDAVEADIALVAPSFPANKRVVKDGCSYLSNNEDDLGESTFSVSEIIQSEMTRRVESIPLEIVRQGTEKLTRYINSKKEKKGSVFVADAINDDDLKIIAMVPQNIESKVVLCGSAGLAQQLADSCCKESAEEYKEEEGITLLVVGTRSACTASQIKKMLLLNNSSLIKIPTSSIIEGKVSSVIGEAVEQASKYIIGGSSLITISVSSIFENNFVESLKQSTEEVELAQKIVKTLGSIALELHERFNIKSIIGTGGDTSMQICKSLKADGIELIDEIAPGIPIGRIIGGTADGLLIVTKSGGFGTDDTFTIIIDYLENISTKGVV